MHTIEATISHIGIMEATGLTEEQYDQMEEFVDSVLDEAIGEEFYEEVQDKGWNVSLKAQRFDTLEAWDDEGIQIDPAPWVDRVFKAQEEALSRIRNEHA
jgi:hypothetical protein